MQSVADPKPDRTPEVVPEIRHTVLWRIVSVTALSERRLKVAFVDGTEGEVDLTRFLADPKVEGTVFEALREAAFFTRSMSTWVPCSGRMEPILRRTRCMTLFVRMAAGLSEKQN